jgi:hypothetical protein
MLLTWLESISLFLIDHQFYFVMIILILCIFHPILEAPTSIILVTFLALIVGSPLTAILILLPFNLIGFYLFYLLIHDVKKRYFYLLPKQAMIDKALLWIEKQPQWKHIIVIGLPLLYTYPLRIGWTIKQTKIIPYLGKMMLIYGVMYVGNIALYYGGFLASTSILTTILFGVGLLLFAIFIYRIKPKY